MSANDTFEYIGEKALILYRAEIEISVLQQGNLKPIAIWNRADKVIPLPGETIVAAKRYFRIGTAKVNTTLYMCIYIQGVPF